MRVADGTAWSINGGGASGAPPTVLGVDRHGAVWLSEDTRHIVRYGSEPGTREVLFPRAP